MAKLNFAPRVPIFDANIGVGHRFDHPAPFDNVAALLSEMDRHRVERALIYHVHGEAISGLDGNRALAEWTDGQGRLSPQWTASPVRESLLQLQQFHAVGKVKSVRLHATRLGSSAVAIPFVDWVYGELLEWLQRENLPLWISLSDTPPTDIMDTLKRFPDLVTVLLGAHYSVGFLVHPLLRHLPNAHLELSRYEELGGIQTLKSEFGIERLIYGSFYPRYAMGPMIYSIHHAGLDESELSSICAGNLKRILGEGEGDD